MLETIKEIDKSLFLWLNGMHTSWSDAIFWNATNLTFWIPFYVLIILFLIKQYKKNVFWVLLGIVLTIIFADQFSNFCKDFFQRLRPSHEPLLQGVVHLIPMENGQFYRGGKFSFISGHASNTFAISSFLFFLLKHRFAYVGWIFLWATFVSYTRIAIGVHYPADIICGALAGIFWGWLAYQITKALAQKYKYNLQLN
ncbi:MAG: phosphatase PAP2 family protein [Flammeovirgaceae bacterium]